MIDEKELEEVLIPIRENLRGKQGAWYEGRAELLDTLLVFLHKYKKGEIDMKSLKDTIEIQMVTMADMAQRRRKSEVQEKILKWVDELQREIKRAEGRRGYDPKKDKPIFLVPPKLMKAPHLNTAVSNMRNTGKIPQNIKVSQRKIQDANGEIIEVGYLVEV